MLKRYGIVLLIVGLMVSGSSLVQASGFNIYEAGARATALGGAFTATADDGSAIFYNAAGLSFQKGKKLDINLMPVGPRFKFTEASRDVGIPETGEVEHKFYLVPGTYITNQHNDYIAYGVGIYAPFGLGVEWMNPEEWIGRQVSYDVDIQTVYVTPAISMKVLDNMSFAIGLDMAVQHLSLEKMSLHPTSGTNAIDTEISGMSALNITPSLGFMYKPTKKLTLGAMWHAEKTMAYRDKDVKMTNVAPAGSAANGWATQLLDGLGGSDQVLSSDFKLPYMISLAAAYQFTDRLRVEGDYVYFGWDHFDELDMDFTNDNLDQSIRFDYFNTSQLRFGVDFLAIPEKLKLMAGFVMDNSPQPLESVSPLLPDSDRNDYSFGLQYFKGNWDFTACYMAVIGEERTTIINGEPANHDPAYPVGSYKSVANIFGLGVGYQF